MNRIFLIATIFLAMPLRALPQQAIATMDYLPNTPGDSIWMEEMPPQTHAFSDFLLVYKTAFFRNQALQKRSFGNNSFRYEQMEEEGLKVYLFHFDNGQEYLLEKGLTLFPATLSPNQVFQDEVAYTILEQNIKIGSGVLRYSIVAEGFTTAETPLRNFVDCLTLSVKMTFQHQSGLSLSFDVKEWYAKGVGLVKFISKRQLHEKKGKTIHDPVLAMYLKKGITRGRTIEGKN